MTAFFRGVSGSLFLLLGLAAASAPDAWARSQAAPGPAPDVIETIEPPARVPSAEDIAFEAAVAALGVDADAEETRRCHDYADALRAGLDDAKTLDRYMPALDETGDPRPLSLREKTHPMWASDIELEACTRFSLGSETGTALERTDAEARRNSYACCLAGFRQGMERIQGLMEAHPDAACNREYLDGMNGAHDSCGSDGSSCPPLPRADRAGCYSEGYRDGVLVCAYNVSDFVSENAAGIDTTRRRGTGSVAANGGSLAPTGDQVRSVVKTGN